MVPLVSKNTFKVSNFLSRGTDFSARHFNSDVHILSFLNQTHYTVNYTRKLIKQLEILDTHGRLLPINRRTHAHTQINLEKENILTINSSNVTVFVTYVLVVIFFFFFLWQR